MTGKQLYQKSLSCLLKSVPVFFPPVVFPAVVVTGAVTQTEKPENLATK